MKTTTCYSKMSGRATRALLLFTLIGLVIAAPAGLQSATVSDLLERGVYSEETKGDLDAAVKLYQQVVRDAKAGEAAAAQAQYRLGVCYYKQGKYELASDAFEKVVQNFPERKELVRLASDYLAGAMGLRPAPWSDGEEMKLTIKTATGFELGYVNYSVYSDKADGEKIWRLSSVLAAGPKQASVVSVEADSFKPIQSRWKHTVLGDAKAVYSGGQAEVWLAGKEESKTKELEGVCYDNEEVVQLIRRLPLAPEYRTTLRVFTSLGGAQIIPIEMKVEGREEMTVPAGTFDCFRIHLGLVDQTFWYSADEHRYLVRFDAGPISAELTGVEQHTPRELKAREDDLFGFALGKEGGGVPTIEKLDTQPLQNQAKVLVLSAVKSGKPLQAGDWCDTLKNSAGRLPELSTDTPFALNAAVSGRVLTDLPGDTVVFFETDRRGWNQSGGAELLVRRSTGAAVAFADGRALLVDPAGSARLRWKP